MNDQTTNPEINEDDETGGPNPQDELSLLKERAKLLGIPLGGNVGAETLKKKIAAKLAGEPAPADEPAPAALDPVPVAAPARPKTRAEREQELRDQLHKEQMALVRCRIVNPDTGVDFRSLGV